MQSTHSVLLDECLPDLHAVHLDALGALNWPDSHWRHADWLLIGCFFPASQSAHVPSPGKAVIVPFSQTLQAVLVFEPVAFRNWPGAHVEQSVLWPVSSS